jgi:hypothetical protein
MTVKQKAARAKFTKAIAEAKKLRAKNPKLTQAAAVKQAFAILYSKDKPKKVGAVKKKAAPKKKAAVKKAAPKKKAAVKITEKDILNKIHKVKRNVEKLDEAQHAHMIGNIKRGSTYIYFLGEAIEKRPIEIIVDKKKKVYIYKTGFGIFHSLKEAKKYISDAKKGLFNIK